MDRPASQLIVRVLAGIAFGLLIWATLSPLYDRFVARAATAVLRLMERPAVSRLVEVSPSRFAVNRSDFDPRSPRPVLSIRNLTLSFVLTTMLFSLARRPLGDRNILMYVLASTALFPTHVFGVVSNVMSIYALQLGAWSTVHYTAFERNFWGAAAHAYGLVLMHAFALAAWWIARSPAEEAEPPRRGRSRRDQSVAI